MTEVCEVDFEVREVVENVFPEHGMIESFGVFENAVAGEQVFVFELPDTVDELQFTVDVDVSVNVKLVGERGDTAT